MTTTAAIDHVVRVATHVPGFDVLTGGGLVEGGLYLVEGRAGAGKTILSSQIAFDLARRGEQVAYITLIAESHGKLLGHLTQFSFMDAAQVGSRIHFLSAYTELKEGGLPGLLQTIAKVLRAHRPRLLVVDGFRSATEFSSSVLELSQFLHELGTLVSALRSIGVLLAPLSGNGPHPEHTLVDGLIELNTHTYGLRKTREIEVHKLRAADHLMGRHMFEIGSHGVVVHPRLESLASKRAAAPPELPGRLRFGIEGLDAMLQGGLATASTTNLVGPPGIGKTLTGLRFLLEGLRQGEPCVFFGFYESPERLLAKAARVGIELEPHLRSGALQLVWQPALEYPIDALAARLLDAVREAGARRLFVDGLEGFRDAAVVKDRLPMFFVALTNALRSLHATALFSEEVPLFAQQAELPVRHLSALFENIVLLREVQQRGVRRKTVAILKMRDSGYDSASHLLSIGTGGLEVGESVPATTEGAG